MERTPLMKQFDDLKQQVPDALLFFRMGDFYELFGPDAQVAAPILEITLTTRDRNSENPTPMAGVPFHSAEGYIEKLLNAGYKVAIAEQVEAPSAAKGLVRREIVRVFTPAVQFSGEGLEVRYLATALPEGNGCWSFAGVDPSTGRVVIRSDWEQDRIQGELAQFPIRHWIRWGDAGGPEPQGVFSESLPQNYLNAGEAEALVMKSYGVTDLGNFFPNKTAVHALGILIRYILKTQQRDCLNHLTPPQPLQAADSLRLGPQTARHLDLFPNAERNPNLFEVIARTRSTLGGRRLKRWMEAPLSTYEGILTRQNTVKQLAQEGRVLDSLRSSFSQVYDMERILGRLVSDLASPRDTRQLGVSIQHGLEALHAASALETPVIQKARTLHETSLSTLSKRICEGQREEAPHHAREGKIFAKGYNKELDHYIELEEEGESTLLKLEAQEREATGIQNLRIKYNRVFGYFFEVSKGQSKNVPERFTRKQSTSNSERFISPELKKFEDEILSASSRRIALESALFESLKEDLRSQMRALQWLSDWVSDTDATQSLALLSLETGWVFPEISKEKGLHILDGRHPIVDRLQGGGFVPNSIELPAASPTLLITGPNMGGKSTVMRQTALIVLLAQMGSPIPAQSARIGICDAIYTRIGAHDAIAQGQSTFMVEMSELAYLLYNATDRSLILLDEIGRGTSTYDGLSVAWAVLEELTKRRGSLTLFATHYHELTQVAEQLSQSQNAHMAVDGSRGEKLRFLFKLEPGPSSESYGVHVAELAGVPRRVTTRAWEILENLESGQPHPIQGPAQLSFFASASAPQKAKTPPKKEEPPEVVRALQRTNLNDLTPLAALNLLAKFKDDCANL